MATEETRKFIDRLTFLLVSDDVGRWKLIGTTILAAGLSATYDLAFSSRPLREIVFLMTVLSALVSLGFVVWYCSLKRNYGNHARLLTGRNLGVCFVSTSIAASLAVVMLKAESRRVEAEASIASENHQYSELVRLFERARAARSGMGPRVTEIGLRSLADARSTPEAWDATLATIGYRSSLIVLPRIYEGYVHTRYEITYVVGQRPTFSHVGKVPSAEAAKYEHIGKPTNLGPYGDQFVIASNGGISLDDMVLRHVIFVNADVYYEGGHLQLDDVTFVNCTFHMQYRPRSENLAALLLSTTESVTANLG